MNNWNPNHDVGLQNSSPKNMFYKFAFPTRPIPWTKKQKG